MGMAKYFEDNMEIFEERLSNCSYYYDKNNYNNLTTHNGNSKNTTNEKQQPSVSF